MGQLSQRGRIGIILASLCALLGAATSASAGCAWVLWNHAPAPKDHWSVNIGTASFPECEAVRKDMMKLRNDGLAITGQTGAGAVRYVCLPDTVDPRGPKGGK